jgi:hypothetical protein
MAKASIAFYKGKDRIFNKLVSWWTRGPYSHTEFVAEGGLGQLSYCWSSSFTDGGVRSKTMVLEPDHWDIVELDLTAEEIYDITEWFKNHVGSKYDVIGLLGFIFRRVADAKNKFFCSEAIGSSLGIVDSWRFDPNTLYAMLTSPEISKK